MELNINIYNILCKTGKNDSTVITEIPNDVHTYDKKKTPRNRNN